MKRTAPQWRSGEDMMTIEERTVGDVLVLSIRGDITMSEDGATPVADKVRGLLQQGHERLVLDLGGVRYVDSAGLGELVQSYAAVRNRGAALKLLHVTDHLNELLVVTRLLPLFDCFVREVDAIASFGVLAPSR